ncbi:hypothetical protein GLYMA_12G159050v4 [Glycine max]|nr:hypothetical protein GLYMA_12G159050v4 [Glycine max]KAH1143402.1 hypothetical protein GYH30_033900 [Glycine max]
MGVQKKFIAFLFLASFVSIIFPLVRSSQEHHQITRNPSKTIDSNHIKVRCSISVAYSYEFFIQ